MIFIENYWWLILATAGVIALIWSINHLSRYQLGTQTHTPPVISVY